MQSATRMSCRIVVPSWFVPFRFRAECSGGTLPSIGWWTYLWQSGGWFRRFSTRPDLFLVNRYWCLRVTDVILSGVFHHSRCTYCVKLGKQFFARKYTGQINLCVTKRLRNKTEVCKWTGARQSFRRCARAVASISLQIAVNTFRSWR